MKKPTSTPVIACILIVGALGLGFASGPAVAQSGNDAFAFNFHFDRTDLTAPGGAERVLARLEQAVRRHCGDSRLVTLAEHKHVEACVNATMETNLAKFGSSDLAEAYRSRAVG